MAGGKLACILREVQAFYGNLVAQVRCILG
jgi:hypothetical protein